MDNTNSRLSTTLKRKPTITLLTAIICNNITTITTHVYQRISIKILTYKNYY